MRACALGSVAPLPSRNGSGAHGSPGRHLPSGSGTCPPRRETSLAVFRTRNPPVSGGRIPFRIVPARGRTFKPRMVQSHSHGSLGHLSRRLGDFYLVATEVLLDVTEPDGAADQALDCQPLPGYTGMGPLMNKKQVYLDFPIKADAPTPTTPSSTRRVSPGWFSTSSGRRTRAPDSEKAMKNARAIGSPLALVTNGQEFSLCSSPSWNSRPPSSCSPSRSWPTTPRPSSVSRPTSASPTTASPCCVSPPSGWRGPPDAGGELREDLRCPGRLGAGSGRAGALDELYRLGIREATMMWLNEEHLAMAMFAPGPHEKKFADLRVTTAQGTGRRSRAAPTGRSRTSSTPRKRSTFARARRKSRRRCVGRDSRLRRRPRSVGSTMPCDSARV